MKIIECPRDAMQGLEKFIPTEKKIAYINQLIEVGFDTLDCGSFVSAKAIPQLSDTAAVLNQLTIPSSSSTKLLVIVANTRGAEEASKYDSISYLGFPLSISETFQKRNTNKSIAEALNAVADMQDICLRTGKELVIYISMGFGNPYQDSYDESVVGQFTGILSTLGIKIISLADTIGISTPSQITSLFPPLVSQFPDIEFGMHLHSNPATAWEKIDAAYRAGCQRFDGAIKGFGGCPMAEDVLVGNLATETIVSYLESKGIDTGLNKDAFHKSLLLADSVFIK